MKPTQQSGWHSRGYLPHFDLPEVVQFITFRLADSLPSNVANVLKHRDDALPRLDHELDLGRGACWLRRPDVASMVESSLLHFDMEHYRMLAWCLMPNHVHAVVKIIDGHSVSDIVGTWKSFTAKRANIQLGRSGSFWHPDYFDRYMRDEDHLTRTVDYVENNPVKTGLVAAAMDWPWSSARLRRQA